MSDEDPAITFARTQPRVQHLTPSEADVIVSAIVATFTDGWDSGWLWEHLSVECEYHQDFSYEEQCGVARELFGAGEAAYLILCGSGVPGPTFCGPIDDLLNVFGQTFADEVIIVDKAMKTIMFDNHHNVTIIGRA